MIEWNSLIHNFNDSFKSALDVPHDSIGSIMQDGYIATKHNP